MIFKILLNVAYKKPEHKMLARARVKYDITE